MSKPIIKSKINNRKTINLHLNISNPIIGCNYFINFLLNKGYKYLKYFNKILIIFYELTCIKN